jgi:hypothetical protein
LREIVVDRIGSDRFVCIATHQYPAGSSQPVPDFGRSCATPQQVSSNDHRIERLVLLQRPGDGIKRSVVAVYIRKQTDTHHSNGIAGLDSIVDHLAAGGHLRLKFGGVRNVHVCQSEILCVSLPHYAYKVFSNIPWSLQTTERGALTQVGSVAVR